MTTVLVPDIGDFKGVAVIEIMVKVGDTISRDQSLVTVESDKASMEIPSTGAGLIKAILVKIGDTVAEGSPLLEIDAAEGAAAAPASSSVPTAPSTPASATAAASVPPPSTSTAASVVAPASAPSTAAAHSVGLPNALPDSLPYASPSVRQFARELGVDLSAVKGTAEKGRITREDVQAFVKNALSSGAIHGSGSAKTGSNGLSLLPWPSLDFTAFGETHTEALSRIKKLSGANLARNWAMIPHVTQFDEADITLLEEFRKSENTANPDLKLTMLAFVIKASVTALKKFPQFNSAIDEANGTLIYKHYFHIGFAADTPNGLVVPVLKNADQKGVGEIASELGRLSKSAREGKLSPKDMQGACFTISSLGGIGGTAFTPIINAPEVAILGLSKSAFKPQWDGKQFVPKLMLPLSLSYDHRVIDGAQAARFSAFLGGLLNDVRKLIL